MRRPRDAGRCTDAGTPPPAARRRAEARDAGALRTEAGKSGGGQGVAAVKTEGGRESSLGFEMWLLYGGGDLSSGRQRAFLFFSCRAEPPGVLGWRPAPGHGKRAGLAQAR
jgi:hypothetical protein